MKLSATSYLGLDTMQCLYLNPRTRWTMEGLRGKLDVDEVTLKRVLNFLIEHKYVTSNEGGYILSPGTSAKNVYEYLCTRGEVKYVGPNSSLASDRFVLMLASLLKNIKLRELFEEHKPIFRFKIPEVA